MGQLGFMGRIAVCWNGVYSPVCDINWDQNDADVFCSIIFGLGTYLGNSHNFAVVAVALVSSQQL